MEGVEPPWVPRRLLRPVRLPGFATSAGSCRGAPASHGGGARPATAGPTLGGRISYVGDSQQNKIATRYIIENDGISFKIINYDKTQTLAIDPALVWATYYAGPSNVGHMQDVLAMHTDGSGVWVTGSITAAGFPTLIPVGAYNQAAFAGNGDGFIMKFTTTGIQHMY